VLISLNPKAGAKSGRPAVESLERLLGDENFAVEVLSDIDALADRAAVLQENDELRCVVAAGGDGTVALVANRTSSTTPIAVLPLGTENLLAKHLSVGTEPADVARTIVSGQTFRCDAGRAGDRVFLLMAGCGFDAEVVRRLHDERTGHIHHLSYAKPIVDSIRSYEYPELQVTCELPHENGSTARSEVVACRWAFVVNLPRYAGGLRIAPHASGDDGLLDVCTFKEGSFWSGLRYLSGVMLGQHESWDDCVTVRATRLRIESKEPVPYQLDGDPGGFLPIDIEALPERLTLLTHSAEADEHAE
jgi:diacylglycerol kinase family enzyme